LPRFIYENVNIMFIRDSELGSLLSIVFIKYFESDFLEKS
jgi:hypothetical protein